jgi:membrane-associated phospholipid phosphatase
MGLSFAGAWRSLGRRARVLGGVVLLGSAPVVMAASVPWTPSLAGRHAIEVLVDDGGLPLTVTQWPLPRDAVQRALDSLPSELSPELEAARAQVQAELRAQQSARIGATVRQRQDAISGFGDDATPGSSLQLRSGELDGPHLAMQIGGRLDAEDSSGGSRATPRLDDTALAVDALGVQAQVWAHRSWWGPGWQSALPLSNNAPALDGIGLQRASVMPSESPWLKWLGPWNGEFFLARTEGDGVGLGSKSLLSGIRLTARPLPLVEVGLTRMVQFGGLGHEDQESWRGFLRGVTGKDQNTKPGVGAMQDSGNGLAGYDLRVRCPAGLRCAVYGQAEGEDDKKHLPYRFMNLLGAEAWGNDGVTRMYLELAEIGCRLSIKGSSEHDCAYRNHSYADGYTSGGRWLGASAGSDARLLTLGWIDSEWASSVRLDFGRVGSRIGSYVDVSDRSYEGTLWALSARRSWQFGPAQITPEFDWNHVATATGAHVESRIGMEMSLSLDDLGRWSPARFGERLSAAGDGTATTRVLTGAALIAGAALLDRTANRYADAHHAEPALKVFREGGSALPYAELGLAGVAWLARRGSADGDIALASVESGLTAAVTAEVLKLAVDRSRPSEGRGAADFGHESRSASSFPSLHTAIAWGVLTPIAQHYDAPWLYGVAALTNVARADGRHHWLSDTVAGSVLGYVVGDWFGKRADASGTGTTVMLMPRGAVVSTTFR